MSATITLLSAGAVKPGLLKVVGEYQRSSNEEVSLSFATAPAILERIERGEMFDAVIAPLGVLDRLAAADRIAADSAPLGRIGVGVLVREGAPMAQLATVEEFKLALLESESIVYNQASTGSYLEALFQRLGLSERLAAKTTRYVDFAAVLEHVRTGKGREIGFGATTVISENAGKGVQFPGPLPEELQNYTAYAAALTHAGAGKPSARKILRYLKTPSAKALLAASGII